MRFSIWDFRLWILGELARSQQPQKPGFLLYFSIHPNFSQKPGFSPTHVWILDFGRVGAIGLYNLRNRVSWYLSRSAPIFRRNPVSRPPRDFRLKIVPELARSGFTTSETGFLGIFLVQHQFFVETRFLAPHGIFD
ncbi:hypothetical protein [Tychonema sp. LEGE 07203]|uniref:hypothetical protein n=1 Tax=Tychonema sp. LEGE 07203 TaxID=1828671 RepID=UPI0018800638|nr:hypothetical protein [Tychonema sp. LEGE 07203]MBE9095416.1 hypothetical protein [Tychonema sp. LEGE 07203]